jgi:hypothetical protein
MFTVCKTAPSIGAAKYAAHQGLGMSRHDDGWLDLPKALRMMPENPATKAAAMTIVSMYGFLLRVAATVKATARSRRGFTRTAAALAVDRAPSSLPH